MSGTFRTGYSQIINIWYTFFFKKQCLRCLSSRIKTDNFLKYEIQFTWFIYLSCSPLSFWIHEDLISIIGRSHTGGGSYHGNWLRRQVVTTVWGQRLCEDSHWKNRTGKGKGGLKHTVCAETTYIGVWGCVCLCVSVCLSNLVQPLVKVWWGHSFLLHLHREQQGTEETHTFPNLYICSSNKAGRGEF